MATKRPKKPCETFSLLFVRYDSFRISKTRLRHMMYLEVLLLMSSTVLAEGALRHIWQLCGMPIKRAGPVHVVPARIAGSLKRKKRIFFRCYSTS